MALHLALVLRSVVPRRGGAETYVADLARRLVRDGHRVDLLADSWDDAALPPEIGRVRIPAEGWTTSARIRDFGSRAAEALARGRYDCSVGFINTWGQDVLIPQGGVHPASVECNAQRLPAGWQRRAYVLAKRYSPRSALYRWIESRQFDPTQNGHYVAVSHFVRGHLERYYQVPNDRIRVIPNAIDPARVASKDAAALRAAYRARHGIGAGECVALFAAHNFRLKGLEPLLQALWWKRQVQPDAPRTRLLVCGGGRLAPYRRMVADLGLDEEVILAGYEPEIRSAFHAADLFVLPTYYDPCSLVVLEALACGLPVITTACNGAGELITPGQEGFVIPAPDDRNGLAYALAALADPETRSHMARHARALAARWTFDDHVARLTALFHEVAARKHQAGRAARAIPAPHPSRLTARPVRS